ncbi:MAG: metal ABC transporter permease [Thermoflexales bacterium]
MAWLSLLADYTMRNVVLGSALLGAVSGALGCFAVLRRQGLLGDTLAHAALPGIALAYLLTGQRALPVLLAGAALSGWLGTAALIYLSRATRIKEDSALGIVLSVSFAVGVVLLTFINRHPQSRAVGLERFLLGQAAALTADQVELMALLSAGVLIVLVLGYKEFALLAFDAPFAASLGWNTTALSLLLTTLIVITVVVGLQAVGVVLMASLLIAPAVAARQWTDRLHLMVWLAAAFGAIAGVMGAWLSASDRGIPTGPVVVLVLSAITVVSLVVRRVRAWLARRAAKGEAER